MQAQPRIALVDIARTLALAAMAVFHFTYDLELFGFAPRGTMNSLGWVLFARFIAGSFIFLSGVSLVLGQPIERIKYLKRLAMIGAAALAVTAATYATMGTAFVRFGILHHIFVASILGLAFLRSPFWIAAVLGALVLALPLMVTWPMLEGPAWLWLGRTAPMPAMVDYVPVLPWFGVFLLGMSLAQLLNKTDGWAKAATLVNGDTKFVRLVSWPSKHSLAIYLIHQPILFGAVYAARLLVN